jgi:transposase
MEEKKNQEKRTGGSLSWAERENVVKDYLTGRFSKNELWQKYTGQQKEHGQILSWMRTLGYLSEESKRKFVKLPQTVFLPMNTDHNELTPEQLKARLKDLEHSLETAQLKVEGYELMIEIAEKELKIPIRKKFDTK